MTVGDLYNMFLLLEMADRDEDSDFVFDPSGDGSDPLVITGVSLDEDGDVCLESDVRVGKALSARELARAMSQFDSAMTVYFVLIDASGETVLYNIKEGGTRDRLDPDLRIVSASDLAAALRSYPSGSIPHFETGTIYYTINSVYLDEYGCICLESNEIDELDNYPASMLLEEFDADPEAGVCFYDDDSGEYYGILTDSCRPGTGGDPWFKIR